MMRYLRLWLYFVRFSLSRSMQFRMDFFFRIIMDTLYYVVNLAFFKIIFLHTTVLGGWTEPQIIVFVSGYLLVDAIQMTLFSNNFWWLPMFVNRGDLDYYLVRPVSSLFFLSFRDFAANSFINLWIALGILVWALARYPEPLTVGRVLLFFALLGVGTLLYYTLSLLFIMPVFWTHSVGGFRQLYWSLSRFMERPDGIFQGWMRRTLTLVLPFSLIASFPARLFIEPFNAGVLVHLLVVAALFFGILLLVWRWALRSYSSASS